MSESLRMAVVGCGAIAHWHLDAFMADNPRGKHGRIAYDLRGQFGLDPDALRARFGYYFERFPIVTEHT